MSAESVAAESLEDLTLEQVRQIMTLADAYKDHLAGKLGAAPSGEAIAADVQAGGSAEGRALSAAIDGLTWPERAELVGLMWYGMGDYETFAASRTFAIATADIGIAQYLGKKAFDLSSYLRTALTTMGYRLA